MTEIDEVSEIKTCILPPDNANDAGLAYGSGSLAHIFSLSPLGRIRSLFLYYARVASFSCWEIRP